MDKLGVLESLYTIWISIYDLCFVVVVWNSKNNNAWVLFFYFN
jgi:hypothetical protein